MRLTRTASSLLTIVLLSTAFLQPVSARRDPAGVALGPCSSAYAEGPTGTNDDFTNLNVDARPVPSTSVTAAAATVVFRNTLENTGAADDAFIVSIASMPADFRAEISTDFGAHYSPIDANSGAITIPVSYRASITFLLRQTIPAGLGLLNSFDTVVRATSTLDPQISNETVDRVYTGFIKIEVAWKVIDASGAHDVSAALPGSEIECQVTYRNISSGDGAGNSLLTATNLVIAEAGKQPPNNWADTTDHVPGATDTRGGYITGDREGSSCLIDTINSLAPGESGVFKFRRRIR